MWRYFVGAAAALLLAGAGVLLFSGHARPRALLPAMPLVGATGDASAAAQDEQLPDAAPAASEKTREQKRFDRYDKDRDGKITRDEYFANRHKAFAKLDANGDGQLSFDEWSAKAIAKFTTADADHSGTLTPAEFATTAVKRKPKAKCAQPAAAPAGGEDESRDQ